MTAAGSYPDKWNEVCLVSIIPEGDSAVNCTSLISEITDIDIHGEKKIETKPTIGGGRTVKFVPQVDGKITLKVHPLTAGIDAETTATGFAQLFNPLDTPDLTQPIVVTNTLNRKKFGVVILWAETLPATATAIPSISKTACRLQVVNAYMTSYKLNYGDLELSAEVTFEFPPFTKEGVSNARSESTDGTAQLPAAITTATAF